MPAGWRRARQTVLGAVLVAFTFGSIATAASDGWLESFQQGSLDHEHWERTSQGDFREWSAEVVPSERGLGYRLRLRADTRGTRDDTLKYLGVRSARAIELRPGVRISVRLDWGDQPNASYMTAGVVLSPHVTGGNPLDTDDWLKLVYVGVPPAGNARLLVAVKRRGGERTVYTDGWPERNKQGRRIAVQDLTLRVGDRTLEVWEGARRAWRSLPGDIDLETVHLYLQMSSHSNYPARSVYFERISVE